MDIQARLVECQQKYNQLQSERNDHVNKANDLLTEMTKLEGEFRVLQELADKQDKPNKKATVVEAVAEKEKN